MNVCNYCLIRHKLSMPRRIRRENGRYLINIVYSIVILGKIAFLKYVTSSDLKRAFVNKILFYFPIAHFGKFKVKQFKFCII